MRGSSPCVPRSRSQPARRTSAARSTRRRSSSSSVGLSSCEPASNSRRGRSSPARRGLASIILPPAQEEMLCGLVESRLTALFGCCHRGVAGAPGRGARNDRAADGVARREAGEPEQLRQRAACRAGPAEAAAAGAQLRPGRAGRCADRLSDQPLAARGDDRLVAGDSDTSARRAAANRLCRPVGAQLPARVSPGGRSWPRRS